MSEAQAPRTGLADPVLTLKRVGVSHDESGRWTPEDVSLSVAPGEVVLLLGPSGCGKSTLALTINGLIPQSVPATARGSIIVGGQDAQQTPVASLARDVAMVFQDPDAQVVTQSVLDEVCFGPENLLIPADEVLVRAEAALRQVGLWHRRHDNPDRLSGGGRQRLAIACALALQTPLLVLDEPTANLDPSGVAEVYSVLKSIVTSSRPDAPAVLLIEHNLDAAMELIDKVVVLDERGRVLVSGPGHETLRSHAKEILRAGIWLPISLVAALSLSETSLTLNPLPVTTAQLGAALDALPTLPAPIPVDVIERSPAAEPVATMRGVSVARGGSPVLQGIDLDIFSGELLAVVGANGAGKTTLLHALAGITHPSAGVVRIAGQDVAKVAAATGPDAVGFVFQNPEHQFVAASVYDELAYGLRLKRRGRAPLREQEVDDRVSEMLARFGLASQRDSHPFLLSGGQKRRLSVGTALITEPKLLVLDEPTFGQDRARANALLEILSDLKQHDVAIVMVTHDLQLVADHADRVAVLADGGLGTVGPTLEVLENARLLQRAGLRVPPLAQAMRGLTTHPSWQGVLRLRQLPGFERLGGGTF